MATVRNVQANFSAGEVSSQLKQRIDLRQFYVAAQSLKNLYLHVEGGVSRRPGTYYRYTLPGTAKLIDFRFNDSQQYMLAFGNARMDAFSEAGAYLSSVTSQPWTTAMLPNLNWAQSGDTLIVVHEDLPMQMVLRTGATTFSNAAYAFDDDATTDPKVFEPFYRYGDTSGITLTPSATTGTITLTASSALFSTSWEGHCVQMDGGKYVHMKTYLSTTTFTAVVKDTLTGTGATDDWLEPAFHDDRGYPRVALFHDQRLWFMGSKSLPDGIWGSKTNEFFNFDAGTGADSDSVQVVMGEEQINEIRAAVGRDNLQIFTDQGEFRSLLPGTNTAITPANMNVRNQTQFGSSRVRPTVLDGVTLFVQKTGKAVREYLYSAIEEKFSGDAVSLLASHLIKTPVDMSGTEGALNQPEKLAFIVNTDGTMSVYNSVRAEDIRAWVPWETDGEFVSVRCLDEQIFVVVKRTINSSTVYYLEEFSFDATMDCAKDATGPASTWTGLSHLEAETVDMRSGYWYLGTDTVASGQVVTSETFDDVQVGMPFTWTIQPMPVEPQYDERRPMMLHPKRINRVLIPVKDGLVFAVNGRDVLMHKVDDDFSVQPVLRTEVREVRDLGYQREATIEVTGPVPLPITILGLTMEVAFE